MFNVLTNLYWLITTDNTTSGLLLPSVLKPNWRFCLSCEATAPPRSYHCHVCDKCVLKRDHHCVFSGCCIGYKNFRYSLKQMVFIYLFSHFMNKQILLRIIDLHINWRTVRHYIESVLHMASVRRFQFNDSTQSFAAIPFLAVRQNLIPSNDLDFYINHRFVRLLICDGTPLLSRNASH